jgi:hypothetical protein
MPVAPAHNPLVGFMRQPKIYITLPSNGMYWEEGSLDMPETGELPVYSMTAKDELAFKTPDALMNGQAVVDVIQSCVPNIKDAWKTPNIDLDLILVAIRIATYGEKMSITHRVPVIDEEVEHSIDLRYIIDQISRNTRWEEEVVLNNQLTCYIRPLTYKHITKTSIKAFEMQKIMQTVNDDAISDERKIEIFSKSFKDMTDVNIDLVANSVVAIKTPETVVRNPVHINEFIRNADSEVVQKIQKHISNLKTNSGVQPLKIQSLPEHVDAGAPEEYDLPISFNNSDFFGIGS